MGHVSSVIVCSGWTASECVIILCHHTVSSIVYSHSHCHSHCLIISKFLSCIIDHNVFTRDDTVDQCVGGYSWTCVWVGMVHFMPTMCVHDVLGTCVCVPLAHSVRAMLCVPLAHSVRAMLCVPLAHSVRAML